jgi:hypothetical protein
MCDRLREFAGSSEELPRPEPLVRALRRFLGTSAPHARWHLPCPISSHETRSHRDFPIQLPLDCADTPRAHCRPVLRDLHAPAKRAARGERTRMRILPEMGTCRSGSIDATASGVTSITIAPSSRMGDLCGGAVMAGISAASRTARVPVIWRRRLHSLSC